MYILPPFTMAYDGIQEWKLLELATRHFQMVYSKMLLYLIAVARSGNKLAVLRILLIKLTSAKDLSTYENTNSGRIKNNYESKMCPFKLF